MIANYKLSYNGPEVQQLLDTVDEGVARKIHNHELATLTSAGFMSAEDKLILSSKIDGAYVADGYLYLTSQGEVVVDRLGPFGSGGGGGGGSSNNAVLTVTNTTGWLFKSVALGVACPLTYRWTSIEDGLETGSGTVVVRVNNIIKYSANVQQGDREVDVGNFLTNGSNSVRLTVTDAYDNSKSINYTINVVSLTLTSTFDYKRAYTGPIFFPYTPTGDLEKTIYFIIDGKDPITATVMESGRQQDFTIPAQTHGNHSFFVYCEGKVDEEIIPSNGLYYDLICYEEGREEPIITSSYRSVSGEQYISFAIPYLVYDPMNLYTTVKLLAGYKAEDGTVEMEVISELENVDRTEHTWVYRPDKSGALVLQIQCGDTVRTFNLNIAASSIPVSATTNNLKLYMTSYGRSNNEVDPSIWESQYGDEVTASLINFNWASDGWQVDEQDNTVLRVSGDARVEIPFQIFKDDFRTTGETIEIEFSTRDVLNYDSVILSCWSNDRGIKFTPQLALFKSEGSESQIQYKEDELVRITFVIEKRNENRLLLTYINGVICGATQYLEDDDFSQANPVGISIGSNDCTIDIYTIRVYNNNLTRYQVLDNWIADTQDGYLRKQRYERNNVFDSHGAVVISQLPADLPYMILTAAQLPQSKGDKKTISVDYFNPQDSTKNFSATGAQADVQGTSSAGYARKNYKIKYKNGFVMDGTVHSTYSMNANAIGVNTFTYKADVASSEGANNVELVRLYDNICPYRTPPQLTNSSVRQGIDGFPMVIFHNDGATTKFVGKYNFNNDKGTPEVFGFDDNDESWEIRNNTSNRVIWKNADFSGTDWLGDFEGRHPDGNTDPTKLAALAAWIMSTDTTAATGNTLSPSVTIGEVVYTADTAEYRLAKFKNEFENYFNKTSTLFYYLFTLVFLMVDSRAKNAFPTIYDEEGKWCWLPYDMDTAIGINNEGALAYGYSLEDVDTIGDAKVFNGQDSVLWNNVRVAFADEIKEMYSSLRSETEIESKKFSYAVVEKMFEDHQAKWPEAIFNEDSYYKYLEPLIAPEAGTPATGAYLSMLQGSKAEQRKWWLYNRFKYMDSKFIAGDALVERITLRGYAKSDITITPYADMYPTIQYGSYWVQERGIRGNSYTLECPLDKLNDTEIYIYSAPQIADIGDLSGLKVGFADFSYGVKLQSLKIGDADSSYSNTNLKELIVGTNRLLRTIDVRNCSALGTDTQKAVDLSGCTNIEEAYFDGTAITSVSLPNGGILKTLHLPGTVNKLIIKNQPQLTDFDIPSYSQITTLSMENAGAAFEQIFNILDAMADEGRVRLIDFDVEMTTEECSNFINKISRMRGLTEDEGNLDKAQISGIIRVNKISVNDLSKAQNFPSLVLIYNEVYSAARQLITGEYSGIYSNDRITYYDFPIANNQRNITGLILPNVTRTGLSDVDRLNKLTIIHLPKLEAVTSYNLWSGADNLTSLNLDSLTLLDGNRLTSVKKLQRMDFPSLTTLGGSVFKNAPALEILILRSETMCNLTSANPLSTSPIASGTGYIYVPKALIDEYKVATNWSTYANQFRAIEDYPDICGG